MAATFPFMPGPTSPFQFLATLDGVQYLVTVTWNLSGQRWFVNVTTLQGVLFWCQGAVASSADAPVNLVPVLKTSVLYLDADQGAFVVTP